MTNQRGCEKCFLATIDLGDKAQTQAWHMRVIKRNRLQKLFAGFGTNFQAHHFNSFRASFITSSAGNVRAVPLSISPRRRSDSSSQAASEFASPGASRSSISFRRSSVRSFWLNAEMSLSMAANARALDYGLRVAAPQFYREVRADANDEVERRGASNKGTSSGSSTPSLAYR